MIRSDTLKSFVKMHETKLNAKIAGQRARQFDSDIRREAANSPSDAAQHWSLSEADKVSRRRPKSHYFNFILTATH